MFYVISYGVDDEKMRDGKALLNTFEHRTAFDDQKGICKIRGEVHSDNYRITIPLIVRVHVLSLDVCTRTIISKCEPM